MQADGKLLAGGLFTQYNGVPRLSLARLTDDVITFTAVSRKVHGASGTFDINLPVTGTPGIESRSGGSNNDYQLVFSLSVPATFKEAVVTGGTGSVLSASGSGTGTVTVNLTGVLSAQTITLTLTDVSVGAVTTELAIQMGVLVGDTATNGNVNASDIGLTKGQSGQAITSANFRSDVNVSGGTVTSSDISLVKSKSGTQLP